MKQNKNIKIVSILTILLSLSICNVNAQETTTQEDLTDRYVPKNEAYKFYVEHYGNSLTKIQIHEVLNKSGCYNAKNDCQILPLEDIKNILENNKVVWITKQNQT